MFDFLKKAFSSTEETLVLSEEEVQNYLEKEQDRQLTAVKKQVFSRFSEIKFILKEVKQKSQALKQKKLESKAGHKRLRKIVQTTKDNFVAHVERMEKRFQPPTESQWAEVRRYCLESGSLLEKDLQAFWKNIAIASTLLRKEFKDIGKQLDGLHKVFLELKKLWENNPALQEIPQALNLAAEREEKRKLIESSRQSIENLGKEIESLRAEKAVQEKKRSECEQGTGFQELRALQAEKLKLAEDRRALKNELLRLFSPVDRPLNKFYQLAKSGNYPLQTKEMDLLEKYLKNTLQAIKEDAKSTGLKKILGLVEDSIQSGALPLKEKEKEKKLKAVQNLKKADVFEQGFWRENKLSARAAEIEKKLADNQAAAKLSAIKQTVLDLENEIEEKGSRLEENKAQKEKAEDELALQTRHLEEITGELMKKTVMLKK